MEYENDEGMLHLCEILSIVSTSVHIFLCVSRLTSQSFSVKFLRDVSATFCGQRVQCIGVQFAQLKTKNLLYFRVTFDTESIDVANLIRIPLEIAKTPNTK